MSDKRTENPVPPSQPKVNRVTGKISNLRPEDSNMEQAGHIDGHVYSENPYDGMPPHHFHNAESEKDKAKRVADFHKKPNSII